MKYAVLNVLIGLCAIALGVFAGLLVDEWCYLICWPGVNFLLLGAAYAGRWPGLFGKRQDGSLPWWSRVFFLPLHLLTLGCWHLVRLVSREAAFGVVNERLIVGRRLLAKELPPGSLTVLDLTAEFAEPGGIVRAAGYRSFPILDTAAAEPARLRRLLEELPDDKPLYIHCAQGHGRTGMVAVAWLISRGYAKDVPAALALLQAVRPRIRLKKAQERLMMADSWQA